MIVLFIKTTYSRKLLVLILQLTLGIPLLAQKTTPAISNVDTKAINAAGGNLAANNFILNWSFGEVFSTTLSMSDKLILTTDFLQSSNAEIILVPATDTISQADSIQLSVKAFPNPAQSFIYLTIDQSKVKVLNVGLYNAQGNLLFSVDEILNTAILYNRTITVKQYAPGIYLLVIKYVFGKTHYRTKVFKIIKV